MTRPAREATMVGDGTPTRMPSRRSPVVVALTLWGVAYAAYRTYYAVGGTVGMIGQPVSAGQFRLVNALGAAVILGAAILPPLTVRMPALRRAGPILAWIAAVGCCMHALVDGTLRVLSILGLHPTQLPAGVWRSFDRHTADLQDLLFNEPWFFVEGLLWAAFGLAFVAASRRRAWLVSVITACLLLTGVGVLTGLGTISSFHLG